MDSFEKGMMFNFAFFPNLPPSLLIQGWIVELSFHLLPFQIFGAILDGSTGQLRWKNEVNINHKTCSCSVQMHLA